MPGGLPGLSAGGDVRTPLDPRHRQDRPRRPDRCRPPALRRLPVPPREERGGPPDGEGRRRAQAHRPTDRPEPQAGTADPARRTRGRFRDPAEQSEPLAAPPQAGVRRLVPQRRGAVTAPSGRRVRGQATGGDLMDHATAAGRGNLAHYGRHMPVRAPDRNGDDGAASAVAGRCLDRRPDRNCDSFACQCPVPYRALRRHGAYWLRRRPAGVVRRGRASPLASFARGLRAAAAAVVAALREPWSNGQTDRQFNRPNTRKRQIYRRASIALLRARPPEPPPGTLPGVTPVAPFSVPHIRPERPDVSPAMRCDSHRCEVMS